MRGLLVAFWAGIIVSAGHTAGAQDVGAGQFGASVIPFPDGAAGETVVRVDVRIGTSSGDPNRDAAALRAARAAVSQLVGRPYRPVAVDAALQRAVAGGPDVSVTQQPIYDPASGEITLSVSLDLERAPAARPAAALLPPDFPLILQNDRAKLTFILGGGLGVYSDINPWFGQPFLFNEFSPIAGNLPGSGTTWGEGYLEFGIGGAAQVGDLPFYVYGAASALFSASRGQDIYTNEPRQKWHPGKGYVGLLYADRETGNSAQLTFGRQTWTLNDGFLISMVAGSSNAGERGATYLGPRNSTDFSAIATGDFGEATFALFYIDPDELESLESNTTFAGANLGYRFSDSFSADATVIAIPTSDSTFRTPQGTALPRQGITTFGLHGLYRQTSEDRFWVEGEYYRQTNSDYAMSADAWYATVGRIWESRPWSPSVSLRLAGFSGDDPATERFERFDPLMSTGLGNWLQGVSFGKVYRNANLNTFRLQVNVVPRENMNLTFEWHKLMADELNNLGGNPALATLASDDIGDEFTATLRWAIDRNAYLQVVASHAVPGRALRAVGADEPWTTVQASIYVNF